MKKKNKNRRILYGYHNLRELSERALRNLDGAMDNAQDVAVMRYVLCSSLIGSRRTLRNCHYSVRTRLRMMPATASRG